MLHRWNSFQYRLRFPSVTPEMFDEMNAIDVEWDFQFGRLQDELEEAALRKQGG